MVKLKLPVTSLRTKLVAITLSDPDKFKDTQTLSNLLAAPNFLAAAQYTCRPTTFLYNDRPNIKVSVCTYASRAQTALPTM